MPQRSCCTRCSRTTHKTDNKQPTASTVTICPHSQVSQNCSITLRGNDSYLIEDMKVGISRSISYYKCGSQ